MFVIRCSVFGVRCSVFGIAVQYYSVFVAQYSIFVDKYSVFVVQYSAFVVQYSVFVVQYSVFVLFGIRYSMCDVPYKIIHFSGFGFFLLLRIVPGTTYSFLIHALVERVLLGSKTTD